MPNIAISSSARLLAGLSALLSVNPAVIAELSRRAVLITLAEYVVLENVIAKTRSEYCILLFFKIVPVYYLIAHPEPVEGYEHHLY